MATACPAPPPPADAPLLIGAATVAALLTVDKKTVQRMDAAGKLPAPVRINPRVVRWRADELRAWVAAGCPGRAEWNNRAAADGRPA